MVRELVSRSARVWLGAARIPVSVAQRIAGRDDDVTWGPVVAYDTVASNVKLAVGTIIGDPRLMDEGRVQAEKVQQVTRAAKLEAHSEQRRAEADAELERRREEIETRRQRVEEEAERGEAAVAEQEESERERVRATAASKSAAVRQRTAARAKAVSAQERTARTVRVEEQAGAVRAKRDELAAKRAATELDRAIEVKKSQRKAKRQK